MANENRGEVDLQLGGEKRTLRFRTAELMLLETQLLKMDVTQWLVTGSSQQGFVVYAILAGLSGIASGKKITLAKVQGWVDAIPQDEEHKLGEMQEQILYAIARGKPGKEGLDLMHILEESFAKKNPDQSGKDVSGPLSEG